MKKFLQVSGVIFWIQVIAIACYASTMMFNTSKYRKELIDFISTLEEDILKEQNWDLSKRYFSTTLLRAETFGLFKEAINSAGRLSDCQYQLPVEVASNQATSEATAVCEYQKSEYKFNFRLLRTDGIWLIKEMRVTSDAFTVNLEQGKETDRIPTPLR